MINHTWDQLPVYQIPYHIGILVDQVIQHVLMHLRLRERGSVVNSHGLCQYRLTQFRVTPFDPSVIHIIGVTACGFLDIYRGPFWKESVGCRSHVTQQLLQLVKLLWIAAGGCSDAQRYAEDLAEHVPKTGHVFLRDGLQRTFEIESQIMCASGLRYVP